MHRTFLLTSKRPAIQCRWFCSKGIDSRRGLFGMVGLYKPSDFAVLGQKAKDRGDELLEMIYDAPADRTLLALVDELSDELSRIIDVAEAARQLHPIKEWSEAAHQCHNEVASYIEKVNCDERAFALIKRLAADPVLFETLTIEEKRIVEQLLRDMKFSGIGLSPEDCQEVLQLQAEVREHARDFQRVAMCAGEEMDDYFQVPPEYEADFYAECDVSDTGGKIPISHTGIIDDLLNDATAEIVRREVYLSAYSLESKKVSENKVHLENIFAARRRLAKVVGFPTFAHLALNRNIIKSPAQVNHLLTTIADRLQPKLQKEMALLRDMKKKRSPSTTIDSDLHPWDVNHLMRLLRKEHPDEVDTQKYLSMDNILKGLDIVLRRAFGCHFDVNDTALLPNENWAPDSPLSKLTVRDNDTDEVLGIIFLDIWERENKLAGPGKFMLQGGCKGFKDGKREANYRVPECIVNCGFRGDALVLEELVTLFHEMGHALHSILARTDYQQLSGTRTPELDFAEIPSTLMEHFAMDYRVLSTFAIDEEGQVIPEEVVRYMRAMNDEFAAHTSLTSATWALFDQMVYAEEGKEEEEPCEKNLADIHADLVTKYIGLADRRVHLYTQLWHLVHYGASYHCYLLARTYASHIWHTHFAKDPLSLDAGREWREKVLRHGGAREAKHVLQEFMNVEEPNIDYFIQGIAGRDT